jgi:SAM-dependent methyltransferase
MKIAFPYKRLFSLWGDIDRQHNQLIEARLKPHSVVLDVGCGYGSLLNYLDEKGHTAEGIDISQEEIDIANQLFPQVKIHLMDADVLEIYLQGYFDAVILKDALHHLVGEHDIKRSLKNFHTILKNDGRIVILDPNPNAIVRFARRLINHKDPEATLSVARQVLEEAGFACKSIEFFEVIGLPLSGGYVGIQLVPNFKPLNQLVVWLNYAVSKVACKLGIGSYICWRYVLYAEKTQR